MPKLFKKSKKTTSSRPSYEVLFVVFSFGVLVGLTKHNLSIAFSRELTAVPSQDTTITLDQPQTLFETRIFPGKSSSPSALAFSSSSSSLSAQDSTNATVMGMATNYGVAEYQHFVGSLRRTGYKGNIILVVSAIPLPGVEKYLNTQNVTMKRLKVVNCTTNIMNMDHRSTTRQPKMDVHAQEVMTCADPYPDLKIRWGRFALLRDYLEECQSCTGPVLVADVRDTFFQRDPFGPEAPPIPPGQLQVFEEHRTMRTTHWLVKGPVERCKKMRIFDKPMLCSGTTIGTRDAMLRYLTDMVTEMRVWMKSKPCCCNTMSGDDQSIHNYLYYTGKLPYATAQKNRVGLVHTVGSQGAMFFNEKRKRNMEELGMAQGPASRKAYTSDAEEQEGKWLGLRHDLTDEKGFFIDFNGERSFIVHQYDRFGTPFTRWFNQRSGLWQDPI